MSEEAAAKQRAHRWEYCNHCQSSMVVCGKCGNNCCNGGYGELAPGLKCDACPSAYAMQGRGDGAGGQMERV